MFSRKGGDLSFREATPFRKGRKSFLRFLRRSVWIASCDAFGILLYMKGFVLNIEETTLQNTDYRRVLYTGKNSQLVLMNIQSGDEIGEETHKLDQFIRIEQGRGILVIDGVEHHIENDWAFVIPAGACHNVINTGEGEMKLYSIYSPPEHKDGTVHATKAEEKEEHFDGLRSE